MPTKDELETTLKTLKNELKKLTTETAFLKDQNKWLKTHAEESGSKSAKFEQDNMRLIDKLEKLGEKIDK